MAAGGRINHPKSVFGKKRSFQKESKMKKTGRKMRKNKETKRLTDALTTGHILKKTRTNPNANITLSGKKKRLLLKQLKREEMEKQKMDVVIIKNPKTESTSKKDNNSNIEKMDIS